jgi:hypothetical protein
MSSYGYGPDLVQRSKLSFRRALREALLFILAASICFFIFVCHNQVYGMVCSFAFGAPTGLAAWLVFRVLRFAIGR